MDRRHLLRMLGSLIAVTPMVSTSTALAGKPEKSLLILDARIAGFAYHDGNNCIKELAAGDILHLVREPDNSHDKRAIAIYWQSKKLGYVPRIHNRALSQLMDGGERLMAEIKRLDTDAFWEPLYFTVRVMV